MGEQHRCGVQVVECEVTVGNGVERVAHRLRRQRQGQRRPGEGAGPERARRRGGRGVLEASPVALEHLDPCVQVVADRHRLRSLQVGVAGQRRLGLALGEVEDRLGQPCDARNRLSARVLEQRDGGSTNFVAKKPRPDVVE